MRKQLGALFARNGIGAENIEAAGFGLAGADLPYQVTELKKRVKAMGFKKFEVANDGILGIKGACANGVGLCAVNGTGTVVIGTNERGDILQVGGIGYLSGDGAGGSHIRDRIIGALYAFYYRCGSDSSMFNDVLELLNTSPEGLPVVISEYEPLDAKMKEIIAIGARAAYDGDSVARKIFADVGKSIGQAAAGCIKKLGFSSSVDIVQIGSMWHKLPNTGMNEIFLKTTEELSGRACRVVKFTETAALGGVKWAMSL